MRQLSAVVSASLIVILYPVLLGPAKSNLYGASNDILTSVENNTDRWIELQQRVANEQDEWELDREVLTNRRAMMEEEQASLRENIESYALANRLYESTRIKLDHEFTIMAEANEAMDERLENLELRVMALAQSLPDPLRNDLDPILRAMRGNPGDPDERSVASRAQSLTAVIATVAQFGNTINLSHTLRPLPDGDREIDVKVLYWGLSFGYATDATGERAWLLRPSPDGWSWEDRPDQAARFKALIDIYEKQMEPELITVPVQMGR